MLHSFRIVIEGVEKRSANRDSCRTKAHCFKDVRTPTDAAVDVNFEAIEDLGTNFVKFEEDENAGWRCVKVATAVIADCILSAKVR